MQVIYFSNAINKDDYKDFISLWKVSPNPSNQNFHNKMIRSLAKIANITAISVRPFSKELCNIDMLSRESVKEGNITWEYLEIKDLKFKKTNILLKQLKGIKVEKDAVVITDTINLSCLSIARCFASRHHLPIVGVCTDNPNNISFINKLYKALLFSNAKKLDGYIALTDGLNSIYNKHNKPVEIIHGIVEEPTIIPERKKANNYFFFGGAMLPQYGVYNLIEAYKKLDNCNKKLIICGHHYDENKIIESIKDNNNIAFLKTISIEQVHEYERNAFANINPRPKNVQIDDYSIPSKTLDALNSGSLTICVSNPILEQEFKDSAIWSVEGNVEELYNALKLAIELPTYKYEEMVKTAQAKVQKLYSLENISLKLQNLLINIRK